MKQWMIWLAGFSLSWLAGTVAAAPGEESWTGTWMTAEGEVEFFQYGDRVFGIGPPNQVFDGTVDGKKLSAKWNRGSYGQIEVKRKGPGSFKGEWGWNLRAEGGGRFDGERKAAYAPSAIARALEYAIGQKSPEMVDAVLAASVDYKGSADFNLNAAQQYFERTGTDILIVAVKARQTDTVRKLLAAGKGANYPDKQKYTALHHAAKSCQPEVVDLLLAGGAEVNGLTSDGTTPLSAATQGKCADAMRLLLVRGADPSLAPAPNFSSPLGWANSQGWVEGARILLDAGANPDGVFSAKKYPLRNGDAVKAVLAEKTASRCSADSGSADDCLQVARDWAQGANGLARDADAALRSYDRACSLGSCDACFERQTRFSDTAARSGLELSVKQCRAACNAPSSADTSRFCSRSAVLVIRQSSLDRAATDVLPMVERACDGGDCVALSRLLPVLQLPVARLSALAAKSGSWCAAQNEEKRKQCQDPIHSAGELHDMFVACGRNDGRACHQFARNFTYVGDQEKLAYFGKACRLGWSPGCFREASALFRQGQTDAQATYERIKAECDRGQPFACEVLVTDATFRRLTEPDWALLQKAKDLAEPLCASRQSVAACELVMGEKRAHARTGCDLGSVPACILELYGLGGSSQPVVVSRLRAACRTGSWQACEALVKWRDSLDVGEGEKAKIGAELAGQCRAGNLGACPPAK